MGIILAIANALLLGISNFLLKKGFKDFSPSISFFMIAILAIIIWAPVGLLFGVDFSGWLLGIFVGLVSAIFGQAIYIYVLEKGELSIIATILSSFSMYTVIFSVLFNHERPTLITLLFIILTIVGTIIVSLPKKFHRSEWKKTNLILWAVFAAICVGAADTLTKYYINVASVGSFLFYVSLAQVVISFLYLKFDKQPLNQFTLVLKQFKNYRYAFFGSLLITVSTLFLFLAFNYTLASIASPIAASAPVITILLALMFLKEKLTVKDWIGIVLVLVSVITIGITNP